MGWTIDQKKAIYTDTGNGNLLVSAAAGSGKTAVLVERVLQKILSGKSTIDRLLIVTFTEAAASEMRQKIIKRLFEYINTENISDTEVKLIKNQIRLTQTADIMTIDSFCNRVVINNFHALGIDPNIQICDDAMANLMISEAIDEMFSDIYKSDDSDIRTRFKRLTDFYAKDRSNDKLIALILSIYRFTESFADPQKWLSDAVSSFDLPIFDQPTVKFRLDYTKSCASRALSELNEIDSDDTEILKSKEHISNIAQAICDSDDWDNIYSIYSEFFSTPKKRVNLFSEITKDIDSKIAFATSILCDAFIPNRFGKTAMGITQSKDEVMRTHNREMLKSEAKDIVWLISLFTEKYEKIKESRNLYEFSDIEHFAYRLFAENETVRNEYTNKYDEILIDEYQDTNMLQDTIFELISHNNIFMVGDLKQSIYRFRKGDPYIFKTKAHKYESNENSHNRVILSQNFRSRQEILSSVNDVFSMIMSEDVGDVEYSGSELIVRDNEFEYYPKPNTDCSSELHYLALTSTADIDRDVCEARYTARKIHELLNSDTKVYDKNSGKMRPIQKRDIVILENSVKYNTEIITAELDALGIESYIDRSTFFDRREISIMLSLISTINNTHDDIPLISVMRSPIGGFSDNDLALIRMNARSEKYFVDAVSLYAKGGGDTQIRTQCSHFLAKLHRWQDYVRKKSVAQLIWAIYEETCFYDLMGTLDGDEAQTNLCLLYDRAKQFESVGFKGLFNFIKYINQIKDSNNDLEGAKLVGESHDVVRIMTIHKSKGLEFPYVFLLGMGRNFPPAQDTATIRMHKSLGFGLQEINYDKHYAKKTHSFDLINNIDKIESLSERMRLLYVALTRPREKLYVITACNHKKDTMVEDITLPWQKFSEVGKMLPNEALEARGFYSWLCPTAYASSSWQVYVNIIETTIEPSDAEISVSDITYTDSDTLKDSVYKILDFKYPYYESYAIPTRTSVTQLKELSLENDDTVYEPDSRRVSGINDIAELMFSPLTPKPRFMNETNEKPANEIGTLYHLIMAQIDIDAIRENGSKAVADEISRLISEGELTENDAKYVDISKIEKFFESELGIRMINANNIYREKPFQINISACEYDPSLSDINKDDKVILQGIIDCFFDESDGFVLFDYKTDKVKNGTAEIKERYKKQLELYKQAIEQLTNKPVKESYLYLFDVNEII